MQPLKIYSLLFFLFLGFGFQSKAQENAPDSLGLPGDDLNLYAVMDLFQQSPTLEEFEKKLNQKDSMINNLDLNSDSKVDYLRVEDKVSGSNHTIVIQAVLSEKDKQDVAAILVAGEGENLEIQLIGDEDLYGKDYVISPKKEEIRSAKSPDKADTLVGNDGTITINNYYNTTNNTYNTTNTTNQQVAQPQQVYYYGGYYYYYPMYGFLFGPRYVVYVSPYYYGYYPPYYNPWAPYPRGVYVSFHYSRHSYHYSHYHYHHHVHHHYHGGYYQNRSRAPQVSQRPSSPSTRPSSPQAPNTRPSNPSTRPSQANPGYRPSSPSTQPASPSTRPATPSTRPSTPNAQPASPSARPSTPSTRPSTPSSRPSAPASRPAGGGGMRRR